MASDAEPEAMTGACAHIVRAQDCATQWGNEGLTVLSTPAILGIMEQTCVDVLAPTLEPDQMTVGVEVHMHHTAPAALDETDTFEVSLVRTGRNIEVEFSVTDAAGTVVSNGSHRRTVISKTRFLDRLAARQA